MSWTSWLHKLYERLCLHKEGRENVSGGGEKDRTPIYEGNPI